MRRAMNPLPAVLRILLVVLWAALGWAVTPASPVAAKTIAIVYDDSGSMADIRHLPAFAATTLMATINGDDPETRVLFMPFKSFYEAAIEISGKPASTLTDRNATRDTINGMQFNSQNTPTLYDRLSKPPFEDLRLGGSEQQTTVDRWSGALSSTYLDTPFGSIALMLEALTRETESGEEVHFIVITDGKFLDKGTPPVIQSEFAAWGDRIPGNVTAYYVQIVPGNDPDKRAELLAAVAREGIRDGLLQTFLGSGKAETEYTVDSAESLWTSLQDIIAAIARTDRTAQRDFIRTSGERLTFKTPFSVTRVITVGSNPSGPPPRPKGSENSFGLEGRTVETSMRARDEGFPGDIQYQAATTQFFFEPSLRAGEHWIAFDQRPDDDVFLIFDTAVRLEAVVLDRATGEEIPLDGGRVGVDVGQPYLISLRLVDPERDERAAVADLPEGSVFSADVLGLGKVEFTLRPDEDDALGEVNFDQVGSYEITASGVFPGFVAPEPVAIGVQASSRVISIEMISEDGIESCAECGPGRYQATLSRGAAAVSLAQIEARVAGLQAASVEVSALTLPGYLQWQTPQGAPITLGSSFEFPTGEGALPVVLRRVGLPDASNRDTDAPLTEQIALTLRPKAPSRGEPLEITGTVSIIVPEARLELEAHDTGGPLDEPLTLTGAQLSEGRFGSDFKVSGILTENVTSDDFSAELQGPLITLIDLELGYDPARERLRLVSSTNRLCLCWIGLYNFLIDEERSIQLALSAAGQTASVKMDLGPQPLNWELFHSCILNVLILMFFFYLLTMLLMLARARTFPKRAHVLRVRRGSVQKLRTPLRKFNASFFLRVLGAPLLREVPHQRAFTHGVWMEPGPGGAMIQMTRDPKKSWRLESGETLGEISTEQPDQTEQYWAYGTDLVDSRDPDIRMTLKNEG